MRRNSASILKKRLDALYLTYDRRYLASDPLLFVHRYKTSKDREIVGLIASSLAYGRVDGIKRSVEAVLNEMGAMGASPYEFVMRFDPAKDKKTFDGFVHRFNRGEDVRCLIYFIRQMIEGSGSIGGFFMRGYSNDAPDIKESLTAFTKGVLALDTANVYGSRILPKGAGVRFFFPSPSDGSPCKRLNLYLRWMVRRNDGLDFGIWKQADPAKLIIPLDTHIGRICRNIGLTKRAIQDWKTAVEITASLRTLDESDPVKYDFAVCRLGILEACPRRKDADKCAACRVGDICVL
ncbi:MAG: TIGR02757 family protein [Deltaproteobacteria bacterium]|nr:TIGR02757 family protein [Deltaproteobacteria bacterium]